MHDTTVHDDQNHYHGWMTLTFSIDNSCGESRAAEPQPQPPSRFSLKLTTYWNTFRFNKCSLQSLGWKGSSRTVSLAVPSVCNYQEGWHMQHLTFLTSSKLHWDKHWSPKTERVNNDNFLLDVNAKIAAIDINFDSSVDRRHSLSLWKLGITKGKVALVNIGLQYMAHGPLKQQRHYV